MSLAEQINAAKELVAWWPDDIRISHGLPELGDRHPVRLLQDELIATQNTLDEKDGLVESLSAQVAELQQKSIATRAFDCKELEAQVAELKKDAERYRKRRDAEWWQLVRSLPAGHTTDRANHAHAYDAHSDSIDAAKESGDG